MEDSPSIEHQFRQVAVEKFTSHQKDTQSVVCLDIRLFNSFSNVALSDLTMFSNLFLFNLDFHSSQGFPDFWAEHTQQRVYPCSYEWFFI